MCSLVASLIGDCKWGKSSFKSHGAAQIAGDLGNPRKGAKEEQGSNNLLTIPLAPSVTECKDELNTG